MLGHRNRGVSGMAWVAIVWWLISGHSYELRQELATAQDCEDYVLYLTRNSIPDGVVLSAECSDGTDSFWPLDYE